MIERRPPRWNIASICTPFVGFLFGALGLAAAEGVFEYRRPPLAPDPIAFLIWIVFCVVGLIAAGVALYRRERLWGLAAIGIVLNAPLPLMFLCFVLSELLSLIQ
jgi:hypothetical protein